MKKVLLGGMILSLLLVSTSCKNNKLSVKVKSSLEKVLDINELKSLEYVYNSYVIATDSETQEKLEKIEREIEFVSLLEKNDLTYKEQKALFYDAKDVFDKYAGYADLKSNDEDIQFLNDYSMLYYNANLNSEELFTFVKNKNEEVFQYFKELESEATNILNKNGEGIYDTVAGGVGSAYKAITSLVGKKKDSEDLKEETALPSTIQKALDASKSKFLQVNDDKVYDFMVNRVHNVYTEDYLYNLRKDNMKYAVYYHGVVKLGIDEPVTFEVKDKEKTVLVKLPPVKILDVNIKTVGDNAPKFLYGSGKYKKDESVMKEFFSLCKEDLLSQVQNDNKYLVLARENLQDTVKALCAPFETATQYTFVIKE